MCVWHCVRVLVDVFVAVLPNRFFGCLLFVFCYVFVSFVETGIALLCVSPFCHETKMKTSTDRTFSDETSLVNTSAGWMLMGTILKTQPEAQQTCSKRTFGQLSTGRSSFELLLEQAVWDCRKKTTTMVGDLQGIVR